MRSRCAGTGDELTHTDFEASEGWLGRHDQRANGFVDLTFRREVLKNIPASNKRR